MNSSSRYRIGAVLIVVGLVLVAGSLALRSWGSRTTATPSGIAPPLSGAEKATLVRDGSTVAALPRAFREVTKAMAKAAASKTGSSLTTTRAGELLFEHPELTPLLKAVEHPTQVANSLTRGLRPARAATQAPVLSLADALLFFVLPGFLAVVLGAALRSRRFWAGAHVVAPALSLIVGMVVLVGVFAPIDSGSALWSDATGGGQQSSTVNPAAFQGDLSQLEAIYDDVVPALQYAGAAGRRVLEPEQAVQVLANDPRLQALNGFVTNFSELYGVGVLVTQQAASVSAAPDANRSMRLLDWGGLVAGVTLLLLSLMGERARRCTDITSTASEADFDDGQMVSAGIAGTSG
jgi:hypothetical protein